MLKTSLLTWLLHRIQSKTYDENGGYAAELLSILLQDNVENRVELGKKDGVETILKVLSVSPFTLVVSTTTAHKPNAIAISSKRPRRRGGDGVYGKRV